MQIKPQTCATDSRVISPLPFVHRVTPLQSSSNFPAPLDVGTSLDRGRPLVPFILLLFAFIAAFGSFLRFHVPVAVFVLGCAPIMIGSMVLGLVVVVAVAVVVIVIGDVTIVIRREVIIIERFLFTTNGSLIPTFFHFLQLFRIIFHNI